MNIIKSIIALMTKHNHFLISTHVNPDPDALCSELALAAYLRFIGKKVTILNEDDVAERFLFFPGVKQVKSCQKKSRVNYDVAIIVDCGDLERIGEVVNYLEKDKPLINIDHHVTNDSFGDLNLVDVEASSTGEILYELLTAAKCQWSNQMALCLYAAIMTDTGCFRYENTTPRTHHIAGELRKFSFSATELYRKLYESIPLNDLKEFAKVAASFDALYDNQVIYVELRKKIVSRFSEEFDLRDTIFKYLRSIKGIQVLIIMTEVGRNQTRVNFRSSGKVNVAKLARAFDGGGHKNASGCLVESDMSSTREKVLKKIKELL